MTNANSSELGIVEVKTSIQAADWTNSRDRLIERAREVRQVTNAAEFELAGAIQSEGAKLIRKLENARKEVTAPIDDLKKQIMAKEKELRADIEAEVSRIKSLNSAYATEQARKAEEERRRIEEAERRAAEAQVAAEAAAQADPFGFNAPSKTTSLAPTPLIPTPTVKTAHSSSNRVVEKWDFFICDVNLVPRQFLVADESRIRAFLAAKKAEGYRADEIAIPGIRISASMQVYSR